MLIACEVSAIIRHHDSAAVRPALHSLEGRVIDRSATEFVILTLSRFRHIRAGRLQLARQLYIELLLQRFHISVTTELLLLLDGNMIQVNLLFPLLKLRIRSPRRRQDVVLRPTVERFRLPVVATIAHAFLVVIVANVHVRNRLVLLDRRGNRLLFQLMLRL